MRQRFETEYSRQFSRPVPKMEIEILNWGLTLSTSESPACILPAAEDRRTITARATQAILCDVTNNWREAGLFDRAGLRPGDHIKGPALITEPQTTTFVSADFDATCDGAGNLWLSRVETKDPAP